MRTRTLSLRRSAPMMALASLALLGAGVSSQASDPRFGASRPAGECAADVTLADARRAEQQAGSARQEALLALAQAAAAEKRGLLAAEEAAAERARFAAMRQRSPALPPVAAPASRS